MEKRPGQSYQKRVADINRIYDRHAKLGISNREIWRRHIYPVYGICERTFYNMLKAPSRLAADKKTEAPGLFTESDYGETYQEDLA